MKPTRFVDYIYVIDKGKMIVEGTSEELKQSLGQDVIELKVKNEELQKTQKILESAMGREVLVDELTRRIRLKTLSGAEDLLTVGQLKKSNIECRRTKFAQTYAGRRIHGRNERARAGQVHEWF